MASEDEVPIEFQEHEGMTEAMAPFMTLVLLFGAAAKDASRKEKQALYNARLMLKDRKPLAEVGRAIMDARGPEWVIPEETMQAIEALHNKEDK